MPRFLAIIAHPDPAVGISMSRAAALATLHKGLGLGTMSPLNCFDLP